MTDASTKPSSTHHIKAINIPDTIDPSTSTSCASIDRTEPSDKLQIDSADLHQQTTPRSLKDFSG
jgi:hypothetical protein